MEHSQSAPTLPRLSNSQVPPAVLAARARGARGEAARRQQFLSGLINEDLQKLAHWHGMRPAHEQKRFLRSLDSLYKAYDRVSSGKPIQAPKTKPPSEAELAAAAAAAKAAEEEAMQRAAEEDPLAGPPRSPRAAPSEPVAVPNQPIEVFEQKKRQNFRKNRDPTAEDPNTLSNWLEGQSLTSQTTATTATTKRTRFSDLSMTSLATSICSEPPTTFQVDFRPHKRAFALNQNDWKPVNQHEAGALRDGLPNMGLPDCERLQTTFEDQFGSAAATRSLHKKMYEKVLNSDQHEFISRFLEAAPPQQREQFSGMVRSLEYLRRAKTREDTSTSNLAFDLQENARLWRPPKQRPVFEPWEINISRIPLGAMQQGPAKPRVDIAEPSLPPVPPSPSVSGLGSLPLTRLPTPQVLSECGSA
ncbi:unnamed protein product [Symbiodinium sp. CCMP2592]|nr:unnamed protein product [Symbiodinium sp. CCMP2592]